MLKIIAGYVGADLLIVAPKQLHRLPRPLAQHQGEVSWVGTELGVLGQVCPQSPGTAARSWPVGGCEFPVSIHKSGPQPSREEASPKSSSKSFAKGGLAPRYPEIQDPLFRFGEWLLLHH